MDLFLSFYASISVISLSRYLRHHQFHITFAYAYNLMKNKNIKNCLWDAILLCVFLNVFLPFRVFFKCKVSKKKVITGYAFSLINSSVYRRLYLLYYIFISRKHNSLDLFSHIGIKNISTRAKEKVLDQNLLARKKKQNQPLHISRDAHGIFWRSSKVSRLRLSSSKAQLQSLRTWDTSPSGHNIIPSAGLLSHLAHQSPLLPVWVWNAHLSPLIKSQIFLVALVVKNQWVILMCKSFRSVELLISNTTVNAFVHHSSVHLQMISKRKVLKHEDYRQPLLFEITVQGIGGILACLGYNQTLWTFLESRLQIHRGPQPSIKRMLETTSICHFNVFFPKTSINI